MIRHGLFRIYGGYAPKRKAAERHAGQQQPRFPSGFVQDGFIQIVKII